MYVCMYVCIRQTDRQTDICTGRQAGRKTDREIDRHVVNPNKLIGWWVGMGEAVEYSFMYKSRIQDEDLEGEIYLSPLPGDLDQCPF